MSWQSFVKDVGLVIKESWIVKGAMNIGIMLLIISVVLLALFAVTLALKWFFKHDPAVARAHKFVISLLTMMGVLILVLGGLLGLIIPVIPGLLLLFFALVLIRKYYRSAWLDAKLHALQVKLRFKKGVKGVKAKMRKGKTLKKRKRNANKR